jgi:8-oxo-dGTP pyrophosphatase MutT (NUDIX family)
MPRTGELLAPGDPRLASTPDLAVAVDLLARMTPHDDEQRRVRDRMLAFCAEHPDALHRSCLTGHLTGAAFLLDHAGERALLTHHRKLDRWLQLGGHCDGDGNLVAVALREAQEESGIDDLRIHALPFDVDVHPIPARPGEPEHLHLDARFLVLAPRGAEPVVSDESHELAWVGPDDLARLDVDPSVTRLFDRVFGR